MKVKIYEQLCGMHQEFQQVRRSLKALAKHSSLEPTEIRRFEQLAAEACAATNSYLLEALGTEETNRAGYRDLEGCGNEPPEFKQIQFSDHTGSLSASNSRRNQCASS